MFADLTSYTSALEHFGKGDTNPVRLIVTDMYWPATAILR